MGQLSRNDILEPVQYLSAHVWHASFGSRHLFRHILPKSSLIHKVLPAVLAALAKNLTAPSAHAEILNRLLGITGLVLVVLIILVIGWTVAHKKQDSEELNTTKSISIETVRADAFSMNYSKFGQGEKTLVILPGLSVQSVMGSADAVADAYQILTEEFTVYLFDRRKELPATYSIHEMAKDTAEAMNVLGLENVCLFGTSQGGMMAMDLAINHPELVQKLVLGSTAACVTEENLETVDEWISLAKAGNAAELYLSFGEAVYPKEVFEQYRELLTDAAKTVTPDELNRFIILAEGMKDFNVADDLSKIPCPVLAIGSSDDQVLGAYATAQIAEHLKDRQDFEMYMYDGYGHAAYDTAPDYKQRLLRFFAPESVRAAEQR